MTAAIEEQATPNLKVQQHKNEVRVVFSVGVVIGAKALDHRWVEEGASANGLAAQERPA
jgi:hypothetical protein